MPTSIQVTFDCADPERMAPFWASALGYELSDPPEGYLSWEEWATDAGIPEESWNDFRDAVDPSGAGPRLFFQRVPEPKTVKNRVHLDLNVGGGRAVPLEQRREAIEAEATRLVSEGATRLHDASDGPDSYFVVMQDPEGSEFCLQ